ncbi:unnamed protein product [Microthlaspi erraticum]|uniref:HSF-type DNA-binding domain-containing protein n=1 Tax=Microthlaspi erraticum TaxID=1685480 RepID=A0A6D2KLG0_9BRAS|nr:unnamed protein product [Microthlaspi erraticum]
MEARVVSLSPNRMANSFPRGLPSFYIRVYQIVDDPSLDPIISWSKSNNSFIVWKLREFYKEIVLKSAEFDRCFSRFFYNIHRHGFKRIKGPPGILEFGHENFVRGQPQLLRKMMVKTRLEKLEKKRAKSRARKDRVNVEHLLENLQI